jgi:hypothetical protein
MPTSYITMDDYYVKGEEVLSPFGDGNLDADIIYNVAGLKKLIIAGYMQGYEAGHNDTVESAYTDAQQSGKDWLADAEIDGGLEYTVSLITEV